MASVVAEEFPKTQEMVWSESSLSHCEDSSCSKDESFHESQYWSRGTPIDREKSEDMENKVGGQDERHVEDAPGMILDAEQKAVGLLLQIVAC